MIKNLCLQNLLQIKSLLLQISEEAYRHHSNFLSGASIGAHVRHVLEFYTCLLGSEGIVNYDKRERNQLTENSPQAAIQLINKIVDLLTMTREDEALIIEGIYSPADEHEQQFISSLNRELAYCLEHSIHHQALMKISLIELNLSHLIDHTFGLAPATIRYKMESA